MTKTYPFVPEGHRVISEIGGSVLPNSDELFEDWQNTVQQIIGSHAENIKGSKIIYVVDLQVLNQKTAISDFNDQIDKLAEILDVPSENLSIEFIGHKVDVLLDPKLNRKSAVVPKPYNPLEYRQRWGVDEAFGTTDAPSVEVYEKARKAVETKLHERLDAESIKFKPPVVALTSVFGGPFYYQNLVDTLYDNDVTLLGHSKCGKTAIRKALLEEWDGLFVASERKQLKNKEVVAKAVPYIPEINRKAGFQIGFDSLYKQNELMVGLDFVFSKYSYNEFIKDDVLVANYEGTGFVIGPFLKYKAK